MYTNESNTVPLIFKKSDGKYFFQFSINGGLASIQYKMIGEDTLLLYPMFLSVRLNKYEVGSALIERVLDNIQRSGYFIVPLCPRIRQYIQKNNRYQKLVAKIRFQNKLLTGKSPDKAGQFETVYPAPL